MSRAVRAGIAIGIVGLLLLGAIAHSMNDPIKIEWEQP